MHFGPEVVRPDNGERKNRHWDERKKYENENETAQNDLLQFI